MQVIEGNALTKLVDYNFGDHHVLWDKRLTGEFKYANGLNEEFLEKAKEFKGKIMTLFIDNIRLYPRPITTDTPADAKLHEYLHKTNNLIGLCSLLPENGFIIFTSHSDTPIDQYIRLPFNVEKVYACNALYNTNKVIPFPIGLQRQIGENDNRLGIISEFVDKDEKIEPNKLLYINCGIERNPERAPLAKFESNSWCTIRFDKDSKFFPYDRYNEFLSELRDHRFVVCPKGHGYDTHRIWETLYMRRVPVIIDHPYFRRLLKDFPVLFIKSWDELTKQFLTDNNDLYLSAQSMDRSKLDLKVLFDSCR